MEIERKFVKNYLTKQKFKSAKVASFFIIAVCFVLSQFYWDKSMGLSSYLNASRDLVLINGEYWRLFTTSFIHGDLDHLLSNSLMLFILTYFVTAFYGAFSSIILSFTTGILVNYLVISQYEINTTLVGASGIVYYLWGFWLILYVCIEKQMSIIKRLVRVTGVFLILLIPTTYSPSTSYLAHYIGFGFGVINGLIYYLLKHKQIAEYEEWELKEIQGADGFEEGDGEYEDEPYNEKDPTNYLH